MWEQEKGKGDESEMGAKVNYLELLKQWGNALLRLQIRQTDDPSLDGGILCPACKHIHGRCPDAIYGLMTLADRTGEKSTWTGRGRSFAGRKICFAMTEVSITTPTASGMELRHFL